MVVIYNFYPRERIAEHDLVDKLKDVRKHESMLKELRMKYEAWRKWFEQLKKQSQLLMQQQSIAEENLKTAEAKKQEIEEKTQMLETYLNRIKVAAAEAEESLKKTKANYRRKSEAIGARSSLRDLDSTVAKKRLSSL
ncbi:unnamed protein product [Oikopleura dioica]|uniref:Uncharacterized protein n=1 Tax=Oikopleura dioica TaxID=34765 RepID=E4X6M8_OIKDI|nr:unnamed protein product [Oikopleura dioica]